MTGQAPLRATSLRERYRRLHNRRGLCWWSIVFGYPIARLLVVLVEPVRAITPTRITLVGFATKLAAAVALLSTSTAGILAAAALLQLSQILDSMDGTLARARGQHSALGALLDKLTDEIGLFAICAAVGVRAFDASGQLALPIAACWGACACSLACYMYWVARALAPRAWSQTASSGSGGDDGAAPALSWAEIRREWLRGWLRMPLFLEADLYLWIAVGAVIGAWGQLCVLIAVTQTGALVLFSVYQGVLIARASP